MYNKEYKEFRDSVEMLSKHINSIQFKASDPNCSNYQIIKNFVQEMTLVSDRTDECLDRCGFITSIQAHILRINAASQYISSPNSIDSLLNLKKAADAEDHTTAHSILERIVNSQTSAKKGLISLLIRLENALKVMDATSMPSLSNNANSVYKAVKSRLQSNNVSEAEYNYLGKSLVKVITIINEPGKASECLSKLQEKQPPGFFSKAYKIISVPKGAVLSDVDEIVHAEQSNSFKKAVYHLLVVVAVSPLIFIYPEIMVKHFKKFNDIVEKLGLFSTLEQELVTKAIENMVESQSRASF